MLILNENSKLNVTGYSNTNFILNGVDTQAIDLTFKEDDNIVESLLSKEFNNNFRASLQIGDIALDMGDFIYVRKIITHVKGEVNYNYVFAKNNTNDVVIKEMQNKIKEQEATINFLLMNQGGEPNA